MYMSDTWMNVGVAMTDVHQSLRSSSIKFGGKGALSLKFVPFIGNLKI
jgi:hypothetical protein